jgi:DNA-directed RNA polymerase specialized sigma24 family protein
VILLRYYEGLKLKEVASALQLSDGKVRNRLNKANNILRDRLKEWYYDEES